MEPNTNNLPAPNFSLPQPAPAEMGGGVNPNTPVPETNQQTEAHNMELQAAAAPAAPVVGTNPSVPAPVAGVPAQGVLNGIVADPASQVTADPDMADDSDLIEKAWVEKAKAIVEQTKDDPYMQNKEITKVKASYIKKRYNKDIKLNEEPKQ